MKVSAKDLDSGKSTDITISGSNGLSKEDIDRMIKEAEENKAADQKRKDDAEVKNKAQTYVDEINKVLVEQGNSLDEKTKNDMIALRDEAQGAISSDNVDKLREIVGRLEDMAAKAAQAGASAQGAQGASGAANGESQGTPGSNPDDVVDADFTDKKA